MQDPTVEPLEVFQYKGAYYYWAIPRTDSEAEKLIVSSQFSSLTSRPQLMVGIKYTKYINLTVGDNGRVQNVQVK